MRKILMTYLVVLTVFLITGCSTDKEEINILATTDLHGEIPYKLSSYVKNEFKKDKNLTLVDAGDFFDSGSNEDMAKYFEKSIENPYEYRQAPIVKDMKELGYDSVVLGNHEFILNKLQLDNIISDFEKHGMKVLSANTYKKDGESYTDPYIIKDIPTSSGTVKLGILGLTIKEVGERQTRVDDGTRDGKLVDLKSRELKDQPEYEGKLYMNDLVKDANKWVGKMKEDKADIIVAVVHSGEKPKKPRNPGNRIQDLAHEVEGIDAIVAGHTHKQITQHNYKNKSGENVIVTQPGKHGECISKINFKLEKKNNEWNVVNKTSDLTIFDLSDLEKEEENFGLLSMALYEIEDKVKEASLSEITPFKWDKAYVFAPETPREIIYKKVGYKWRSITETEGSDMTQMVFIKDNKPVCYLYGNINDIGIDVNISKSEYKDNVATIVSGDNDKFSIEKEEVINVYNGYKYERTVTHLKQLE
ncbi:metallophosphoesterase [Clostridioides mangenotii]|uniref:metallophosphoesterase n=1 Tax=Metaclostridioides mangenotii TaxID=1540 RepID=UPI001C10195C|nr:metallophosphoesterase [Clostridioides mangenotii]MBU5306424.1 metallophosphoesterase [Clostridioides mangenotii]